jgi:uncharacterized protein YkwD
MLNEPDLSSAYTSLGQNLFTGAVVSAAAVVADWMASPAHRYEILMASYDRVGVGVVVSANRLWVTANFADAR